jgi:hypothetical protein
LFSSLLPQTWFSHKEASNEEWEEMCSSQFLQFFSIFLLHTWCMCSAETKYLDKSTKEKSRSARMYRVPAAANRGKLAAEKQSAADHSSSPFACVFREHASVSACIPRARKAKRSFPLPFLAGSRVVGRKKGSKTN